MAEIRINDNWSIDRDGTSWQVIHSTPYTSKSGEQRTRRLVTWYATLLQACRKVINEEAKTAEDLDGIIRAIENAEENITQTIIRSGLQTPRKGHTEDLSA